MSIEEHCMRIHFKCFLQVIATKNNPENITDAISYSFFFYFLQL